MMEPVPKNAELLVCVATTERRKGATPMVSKLKAGVLTLKRAGSAALALATEPATVTKPVVALSASLPPLPSTVRVKTTVLFSGSH